MITFVGLLGVRGFSTLLVHPNQYRRSFQQLDLLVLGDEEFGSVSPFWSVLPSGYVDNFVSQADSTCKDVFMEGKQKRGNLRANLRICS